MKYVSSSDASLSLGEVHLGELSLTLEESLISMNKKVELEERS